MSKNFPMVLLGEVLVPVSRPEPVNPNNMYHILGAHWYAKGLYVKDIKSGSGIQADKVYRVERDDFVYMMFLRILFVFLSDNFSSGFLQAA
jgi:hypothetical protein